ncbi:MAG: NADH-quinone oxidoreductase subunit N, partial [Actinobacteria bacterium]|nr:NADH-quinone oxidoreductase subunit N [Actinomycetota bacterium]
MPYAYLLPEAVLVLTALIVLLVDLWAKEKRVLGYLSLLGIAGALTSIWPAAATPVGEQLGAMIAVDTFSFFFKAVFLGVAGMVILAGMDFAEKREMPIS